MLAVRRRDAGALLAAMLQRVETEVGHVRGFGVAEDAEDAALFVELVDIMLMAVTLCASQSTVQCAVDQTRLGFGDRTSSIASVPSTRSACGCRRSVRSPAPARPPRPRARAPSVDASRRRRDTITRDADSPKSAAASIQRSGRADATASIDVSAPTPPVSKQHSASVTASPPSEQSCADRIKPSAGQRHQQPLQRALGGRDRAAGGTPRTRSVHHLQVLAAAELASRSRRAAR